MDAAATTERDRETTARLGRLLGTPAMTADQEAVAQLRDKLDRLRRATSDLLSASRDFLLVTNSNLHIDTEREARDRLSRSAVDAFRVVNGE